MSAFTEALPSMESGWDLRPFCSDGDALGPCPCFEIDQPDFVADGHCWRSQHMYRRNGEWVSCQHEHTKPDQGNCCVHVWGDPALAAKLESLLDGLDWYGPWALTIEGPVPA